MISKSEISNWQIVGLALLSEVLLFGLGAILYLVLDLPLLVNWSTLAVTTGCLAAGAFLVVNLSLLFAVRSFEVHLPTFARFHRKLLFPLARPLTWWGAAVVAICSGIGEEVLFRGALVEALKLGLPRWFAHLICILVFALIHFMTLWREFIPVVSLYLVFGAALSYLYEATGGLAAPIITHMLYNFVALLALKHFKPNSQNDVCIG